MAIQTTTSEHGSKKHIVNGFGYREGAYSVLCGHDHFDGELVTHNFINNPREIENICGNCLKSYLEEIQE